MTGVQTCALPISIKAAGAALEGMKKEAAFTECLGTKYEDRLQELEEFQM